MRLTVLSLEAVSSSRSPVAPLAVGAEAKARPATQPLCAFHDSSGPSSSSSPSVPPDSMPAAQDPNGQSQTSTPKMLVDRVI